MFTSVNYLGYHDLQWLLITYYPLNKLKNLSNGKCFTDPNFGRGQHKNRRKADFVMVKKGFNKIVKKIIVIPGDEIKTLNNEATETKILLGPGLVRDGNLVKATKCGVFVENVFKGRTLLYVNSSQKRYIPALEERVIGIITDRYSDTFKVNIGSSALASLDMYSFEGATKRNKPSLKKGDLVYGRLITAHKDMEPILSCVDNANKSAGMGGLKEGYLFSCSSNLCRRLLKPHCVILESMGKLLPYEITVGLNGRIWVNSTSIENTIQLVSLIQKSEYMTDKQICIIIKELAKNFA
ncbi:putative exosome complex component rrp40 [Zophobas morio]|uniref:putative exosome complex component rrp40 n=1 Tax=Zophobas morio TaxID=2755281 RepID=UPI0030837BCE